MPIIRVATLGDAKPLAELAESTFRDTFAVANTHDDMERHCRSSYGEAIQAEEIADPQRLTLLCVENERLIAFAQLRWGAAPACVAAQSPGEIQRLYVASGWHGRGVAQDLMLACFDAMQARGSSAAWLGVWERNPRAIAFYRKSGFVEVGEHVFALGGDPQRDIVMMRTLGRLSS